MLIFSLLIIFSTFSIITPRSYSPNTPFYLYPENNRGNRIVGGEETDITVVPFTASLQLSGVHSCGCVVLSSTHVLTAAHCSHDLHPTQLRVRFGSSYHAHSGTVRGIRRIFPHPQYHPFTLDFDFSVLELVSAIVKSETIQAIQLAEQGQIFEDGLYVATSGWGETKNSNESRNRIRKVSVPIFNQEKCRAAYASIKTVTDRMICAGYEEGGKDACQGDSGGGLVYNHVDDYGRTIPTLVGLVSWGLGCARPGFPGVYSRVSAVSNWIKQTANL